MNLLEMHHVTVAFSTSQGIARAVNDLSLCLRAGQSLAVVGESGCGKTMLALSILRLLPEPAGEIIQGKIVFEGTDLLGLSARQMQAIRGNRISMIFQDPMTSLNPVLRVGEQVAEVFRLHRGYSTAQALEAAQDILHHTGIARPDKRMRSYPHELSGGMRQRVVIAMALACNPQLILADEPTTALDVTLQAQIFDVMMDLTQRRQTSILLITHDLGVVAHKADRVAVMYAGRIVEEAQVKALFAHPLHPYTRGLMDCVPHPDKQAEKQTLHAIQGSVPALTSLPQGCSFHPRCPAAFAPCRQEIPRTVQQNGRSVRCWLYG